MSSTTSTPPRSAGAPMLHVGVLCDAPLCGRRDFLPFICRDSHSVQDCDAQVRGCGKTFCLEHRGQSTHSCTGLDHRVLLCDACGASVHVHGRIGDDGAAEMAAHMAACRAGTSSRGPAERKAKTPRCAHPRCRERLVLSNRSICTRCKHEFCLAHRLDLDHDCGSMTGRGGGAGGAAAGGVKAAAAAALLSSSRPAPAPAPAAAGAVAAAAAEPANACDMSLSCSAAARAAAEQLSAGAGGKAAASARGCCASGPSA